MRALHPLLHIICNIRPLRNTKGTIVSSHRLERRQDHRSLAMDGDSLPMNLDVLLIHNGLNRGRQLHSIVMEPSNILRLEQLLKTRKERLERLH